MKVYLSVDQNVKASGKGLKVGSLAQVSCADQELEDRIKAVNISSRQIRGPGRYVFSVMDLISEIQKKYPEADIDHIGEASFLITVEEKKKECRLLQNLKAAATCLLAFFGAAFSIMAFNNDVEINKLFADVYRQFTGETSDGFTILEIAYSVGLGAGIILYFNHFGKKKTSSDPTPLEIEMRTYEDKVNQTLIEADGRMQKQKEGKENDG